MSPPQRTTARCTAPGTREAVIAPAHLGCLPCIRGPLTGTQRGPKHAQAAAEAAAMRPGDTGDRYQQSVPLGSQHAAGQFAGHRRGVRARQVAERDLHEPEEFRLSGPHRVRQSAAEGGVRPALLSVAARPARAGRSCTGDRAGNGRAGRAHRRRGHRGEVRHRLFGDDGRRRRAGVDRARQVAQGFRRQEPAAGRRPELHGRLLATANG